MSCSAKIGSATIALTANTDGTINLRVEGNNGEGGLTVTGLSIEDALRMRVHLDSAIRMARAAKEGA